MTAARIFYIMAAVFFGLALTFLSEAIGIDVTFLGRVSSIAAWIMVAAFSGLGVFSLVFAQICERLERIEKWVAYLGAARQ